MRPLLHLIHSILPLIVAIPFSLKLTAQVTLTVNIPQENASFMAHTVDKQELISFANNSFYRWNLRTGRNLQTFKAYGRINRLRMSPDRSLIIATSVNNDSNFVLIYDAVNFRLIRRMNTDSVFKGDAGYVNTELVNVGIHSATGWVVANSRTSMLLFNVHSGEMIRPNIGNASYLGGAAFAGNNLFFAGTDWGAQKTCIWKIPVMNNGKPELCITLPKEKQIDEIIPSPGAKYVLAVVLFTELIKLSAEGQPAGVISAGIELFPAPYTWSDRDEILSILLSSRCYQIDAKNLLYSECGTGEKKLRYTDQPFSYDQDLHFNRSSNSINLFTHDYYIWDDERGDTTFIRQPAIIYGNASIKKFRKIEQLRPGQYFLSSVNDACVIDMNDLSVTGLHDTPLAGYIPASQIISLNRKGKTGEILYTTENENQSIYLREFDPDGLPDSIYKLIEQRKTGYGYPFVYPTETGDSLWLIETTEEKAWLFIQGGRKKVQVFPLPTNPSNPPWSKDNRFQSLPNGEFIFSADLLFHFFSQSGSFRAIDTSKFEPIKLLVFDRDRGRVYYYKGDYKEVRFYDIRTGVSGAIQTGYNPATLLKVRPYQEGDSLVMLASTDRGKIMLLNRDMSVVLRSFEVEGEVSVYDFEFDESKRLLYLILGDYSMRVWDLDRFEPIASLFFGKQGYDFYTVAIDPMYRYFLPSRQTEMLNWNYRSKSYDFSVFDQYYNQPVTILQALRSRDTLMIQQMKKAYATRQKRLTRAGSRATLDQLPVASLDVSQIPIATDSTIVQIPITLKAVEYPVTRFQVFANNVPLIHTEGSKFVKPIMAGGDTSFSLAIKLSMGKRNHIKVVCFDNRNNQSLPAEVSIFVRESNRHNRSRLFYLGYGTSQYKDSLRNLKYAAKDVVDISKIFRDTIESFYRGSPHAVTDTSVTIQNLYNGFAYLAQNAGIDDRVIISFSGHGVADSNGKFYLMWPGSDFSRPSETGLSFDMIFEVLKILPCRQKLVLIDACESGDWSDENESAFVPGKLEIVDTAGMRGLGRKHQSMKSSSYLELMKDYFTDVASESGATIIGASSGKSFALENDTWKNGVFTYTFIKGLFKMEADRNRDKAITVSELKNYMMSEVSRLTGGRQQPSSRNIDLRHDWIILESRHFKGND